MAAGREAVSEGKDPPDTARLLAGDDHAFRADRLRYVADMLEELQTLAAGPGAGTLTGLLALASVEADRLAGSRRSA